MKTKRFETNGHTYAQRRVQNDRNKLWLRSELSDKTELNWNGMPVQLRFTHCSLLSERTADSGHFFSKQKFKH